MALILEVWILKMGFLSPFLHFSRNAQELNKLSLCTTDMKRVLSATYITVRFVLSSCEPLTVIIILNVCTMKS